MPRPGGQPAAWRDWAYQVIAANPIRGAELGRLLIDCIAAACGTRSGGCEPLTPTQVAQCAAVAIAARGQSEADNAIAWNVTDLGTAARLDDAYREYCAGEQAGERRVGAVLAELAVAASQMLGHIQSAGNVGAAEDTVTAWRKRLSAAHDTLSGINHESTT
jgi:hypothetical protein